MNKKLAEHEKAASEELFTCCNPGQAEPSNKEISLSDQPWVKGNLNTPFGPLPVVSTRFGLKDVLGRWKVRWGWGRMHYLVPPGLYALGSPDSTAPVLVTANYKLSFDSLRRELRGVNAWLLVLDTRGVNVWCAAGKGTFSTAELGARINEVRLSEVVSHRDLILPQLGAPGVAAHELQRLAGFKVRYGPIRAADLPAYLARGGRATKAMRQVRFLLPERLTLVPVELVALGKPLLCLLAALILLNVAVAFGDNNPLVPLMLVTEVLSDLLPIAGAALAGSVLVPTLLPLIPGRSFAFKGWLLGLAWAGGYNTLVAPGASWLQQTAYFLALPALSAYLALNYTGSTTFTSLSGVRKEMGLALPAIIISAFLGVVGLVAGYFL